MESFPVPACCSIWAIPCDRYSEHPDTTRKEQQICRHQNQQQTSRGVWGSSPCWPFSEGGIFIIFGHVDRVGWDGIVIIFGHFDRFGGTVILLFSAIFTVFGEWYFYCFWPFWSFSQNGIFSIFGHFDRFRRAFFFPLSIGTLGHGMTHGMHTSSMAFSAGASLQSCWGSYHAPHSDGINLKS